MKLQGTDHRPTAPMTRIAVFRVTFFLLLPFFLVTECQIVNAQQLSTSVPIPNPASLTAEQVVLNLVQMNLRRAQALHAYRGTRTYQVKYEGFPGARSARMVVGVKCLLPEKKEFIVQSAAGSKLIIDRVFKKLLEAEKEESSPEMELRSALNDTNYQFTLIGQESGLSGVMYVLEVEPGRKDKFLYHGRIWVDARDFAVVRLKAEPAKNPSFWTRKADVVQVYAKVNDFWLPAHNHSVTAIRLGGHADLTIDYEDYEVTDASQVSNLSMSQSTLHAEVDHAQR